MPALKQNPSVRYLTWVDPGCGLLSSPMEPYRLFREVQVPAQMPQGSKVAFVFSVLKTRASTRKFLPSYPPWILQEDFFYASLAFLLHLAG